MKVRFMAVGLLLTAPVFGAPITLFDNGSFSGPQVLRNASGPFVIFEDFTLETDATITGIDWSQHDSFGTTYSFTDITFYGGVPSESNLIDSLTVVADRTSNGDPVLGTGNHFGFDYVVDNLSIVLSAGTYCF